MATTKPSVFSPTPQRCRQLASLISPLLVPLSVGAQTPAILESPGNAAQSVVVSGRSSLQPSLSGFDLPQRETPVSLTRVDGAVATLWGAQRLADLTRFDSSVSDAYNATGYIDQLTVRGFVIDNRYNVRRDGLPIQGDTAIALDNKAAIEVLKGTSGLQAGTSAPGGLVNYVVARPSAPAGLSGDLQLQWTSRASLLSRATVQGRAADDGRSAAVAWRLQAAQERLAPTLRNADGERRLWAGAAEWRPNRWSLLEVEGEWSRRSQPTQQAFSLLGNRVPAVPDPRLNLNNQPWSLPTVFEGQTGSVRFSHDLRGDWRAVLHTGRQRLRTDDRLAFAYGLYDPVTFDCAPCDRFSSDGRFSVWDYRSENERRFTQSTQLELVGSARWAGMRHRLRLGVLQSRQTVDLQPQAYNLVGVGRIDGSVTLPADGTPYDPNTNRREHTRELFVQDAISLGGGWQAWMGLRHTRLDRQSVRTNGSRPTDVQDALTTPWLALSHTQPDGTVWFLSRGEGAESQVVPNRPSQYTNAGQALPVLKSVQWEAGVRGQWGLLGAWNATVFQISRPTSNLDACASLGISPCTGTTDGEVRHQGLELGASASLGAWTGSLQGTWLDAERRGSRMQAELNGRAPTNVPQHVVRGQLQWKLPQQLGLAGAQLQALWTLEGDRYALPDNSLRISGWQRTDVALSVPLAAGKARWMVGVDNVADARYWREAPFQFGHAYLYPGAVRTIRTSLLLTL